MIPCEECDAGAQLVGSAMIAWILGEEENHFTRSSYRRTTQITMKDG